MTVLIDFDALWDYAHPDQTERVFRDLLPKAQVDRDYELQLLTQIARAQGLQRRFTEAHATLDEVERRLKPALKTVRLRLLLERGRVFNSSGDPERARPLFEQAWELGQKIDKIGYAVDAGHMLGILEAPALDWSLKSVALAESSSDESARRWLASLYNNIGWTYHDRGDYEQALAFFEKALHLREQQGKPKALRIARWSVARVLRSLQCVDEALAIQQELADQLQHTGTSDGYVDEELGECLLALGRSAEAKPYFARAYAALSQEQWFVSAEADRLERLRQLAE